MSNGKGGFIGQDGINAPDPATGVTGTAGNTEIDVSFTSPSDVGGAPITEYRVTDSTGVHTVSAASSPVTVTGLTNGTNYTFNVWAINPFGWATTSDPSSAVSPLNPSRGLYAGGGFNTMNVIGYFQINSGGENASDFGDLNTSDAFYNASCSSSTRGLFIGGGSGGSALNENIDYVTIATTGNATNFGQMSSIPTNGGNGRGAYFGAACSSSTRGVISRVKALSAGSETRDLNYVTIATTGTTIDFGDLSANTDKYNGALSSPTRGVWIVRTGSYNMEYVTIASTGNSTDFGSINESGQGGPAGASSSTRGLFCTGDSNVIKYITIATTGTASDFGDLTTQSQGMAFVSDSITAVRCGGYDGSGFRNTMDSVTIATTGNATDFGDLTQATYGFSGCSDSHGGL